MADLKTAEALLDNRLARAQWRLALADVQDRSGDHEAARATATDVLETSREIGNTYETCVALQALAESYLYAGDAATGRKYLEEVEPLASRSGYTTILAEVRCNLAYCNLLDGQAELAYSQAKAVLADCETIEYGAGQLRAHSLLGRCCTALGRADEAAAHQQAADAFCERSGYVP